MHHAYMAIVGFSIVGWLLVEVVALALEPRINVPAGMNILGALAGGLIAAAMAMP